jgi:hypothetical protein
MKAIQLSEQLEKEINNPLLIIDNDKVKNICKYNQNKLSCRYLLRINNNFICGKNTLINKTFDDLVKKKQMVSEGDNCEGIKIEKVKEETL